MTTSRHSDSQKRKRASQDQLADNTFSLNPVIGFGFQDVLRASVPLLRQALLQPATAIEHSARLARRLLAVAFNNSDITIDPRDRRFADPAFADSAFYSRLAKAWMAWGQGVGEWVDDIGLSAMDRARAKFLTELIIDSFAPTNTLAGNPSALRRARETQGKSLLAGFLQFMDDLANNKGLPKQVDKSAFTVGKNLAQTPGGVVFRHDILELIQYKPMRKKAGTRPIFIVPPQINKYYVYDLTPDKSIVKFLLEEGFQVFVASWRNPTKDHRDWSLDDYIGALVEAVDVSTEITGSDAVNVVGACAGGITSAAMIGYLTGVGEADKVSSLSLMVNVLAPHSEDSVFGLFATKPAIEYARKRSAKAGILDGSETARIFNWMRPNDLIWNYVVSNYLHGELPPAFDVLYWNSDSTRLPARLHSDFLDVFSDNPFVTAGALTVRDIRIDLKQVRCPVYITGGTTDHITPWKACYRSTQLFGGDTTFVLSTAGHIQSLINPPANSRRKFFTNDGTNQTADEWINGASQHDGSWWPHWSSWLRQHCGDEVTTKSTVGNRQFPVLTDAPGVYVLE